MMDQLVTQGIVWLQRQGRMGGRGTGGEDGQSMVEYSVVVALIAIVCMGAIQALGGGIGQVFQNILNHIQSVAR